MNLNYLESLNLNLDSILKGYKVLATRTERPYDCGTNVISFTTFLCKLDEYEVGFLLTENSVQINTCSMDRERELLHERYCIEQFILEFQKYVTFSIPMYGIEDITGNVMYSWQELIKFVAANDKLPRRYPVYLNNLITF